MSSVTVNLMSCSSEPVARPGETLSEHLENTSRIMKEMARRIGFDEGLAADVGMFHDAFKASSAFQKYISGTGRRVEHAMPSGFLFYSHARSKYGLVDSLAGMIAISFHHGDIRFSQKYLRRVAEIHKRHGDGIRESSLFMEGLGMNIGDFREALREIVTLHAGQICDEVMRKSRMLLSMLMNADRAESFFRTGDYVFDGFSGERIEFPDVFSYVKRLSSNSKISLLRNDVFEQVSSAHGNIVIVDAPTGSGKTLANIALASRMGERMIYSLPYLSIIDQTFNVIKDVVSFSGKNTSVMRSDHRSEYREYVNIDEDMEPNAMKILYDSWMGDIVVTTFNRLSDVLMNPSKRGGILKLYSVMEGSVIIIDEIQAFPVRYWKYLKDAIEWLSGMGVKFILSSATMPSYFKNISGAVEAVMNSTRKSFSKTLNRYAVRLRDIRDAYGIVRMVMDAGKATLVVVNTRKTSVDIYNMLKSEYGAENIDEFGVATNGTVHICNLTTWQYPAWRMRKIRRIAELLNEGRHVILVSTQLIEAGVDISFPVVIRDIAPIDSIIQTAGRCNRSGEFGMGEVVVTSLESKDGRTEAEVVYRMDMDYVPDILGEGFNEDEAWDRASKWYESLAVARSVDDGDVGVERARRMCDIGAMGMELSRFYDDRGVQVVVGNRERIDSVLGLIDEARNSDYERKMTLLTEIRRSISELANYSISIRKNVAEAVGEYIEQLGIYYIDDELHDPETGLAQIAGAGDEII